MNLQKVIIVVGLPGSGKTHLGQQMAKDNNIKLYDDAVTDISEWTIAASAIAYGQSCILTDPAFCSDFVRNKITSKIKSLSPNANIEWIFFENNPEVCARNVENRRDGRLVSRRFVFDMSKVYSVPPVKTIKCWSPNEV